MPRRCHHLRDHASVRRILCVLGAVAFAAGACGDGGDPAPAATQDASRSSQAPAASPAPTPATDAASPPSADVVPGRAIVEAGGDRWEFTVDSCLVGHDQTGSPYSRLSLSGSLAGAGDGADAPFLSASILVSRVAPGHEEHVISIHRPDDPSLGAADVQVPSRGGPAPDDWIEIGDGVVTGAGFELWEIEIGGRRLPPGTLVADCPAADGG